MPGYLDENGSEVGIPDGIDCDYCGVTISCDDIYSSPIVGDSTVCKNCMDIANVDYGAAVGALAKLARTCLYGPIVITDEEYDVLKIAVEVVKDVKWF